MGAFLQSAQDVDQADDLGQHEPSGYYGGSYVHTVRIRSVWWWR
jgi:hypothetical protein